MGDSQTQLCCVPTNSVVLACRDPGMLFELNPIWHLSGCLLPWSCPAAQHGVSSPSVLAAGARTLEGLLRMHGLLVSWLWWHRCDATAWLYTLLSQQRSKAGFTFYFCLATARGSCRFAVCWPCFDASWLRALCSGPSWLSILHICGC
jgi:hypothetical protein